MNPRINETFNPHPVSTMTSPILDDPLERECAGVDFAGLGDGDECAAALERRVEALERRLEAIVSNHPDIFFSLGPDGAFTEIGPGFSERFGMEPGPFIGRGDLYLELVHAKDRDIYRAAVEAAAKAGTPISVTYRQRRPSDGGILHVRDVRTPVFSAGGDLLGYEGAWIDITRQALAESRLQTTAWKETLATVTSGLIHDFSNTMAGIYSLSELYFASIDEGHPWHEGMKQIKNSSFQARGLVHRIIDLNREHSGRRSLFNVESLVADQLDLIHIALPKDTRVETRFTGDTLPVYLDEVAFRQTLLNLALNARDALGDGGLVKIEVAAVKAGQRVFSRAADRAFAKPEGGGFEATQDGVEITFSDSGCGIREEVLDRVFDPFFTTKEAHKGSGFGLYNAKLFIEASAGSMAVSTTPGEGTSFHFFLPLAEYERPWDEEDKACARPYYFKGRPNLVVYAAEDPGGFDVVGLMRREEWEVITFHQPEHTRGYLAEAETLPHVLLLISLGCDPEAEALMAEVKERYPFIRTVLLVIGRNPDEFDGRVLDYADLVLDDGVSGEAVLSQLSQLLR